jgi:hypothetical protein
MTTEASSLQDIAKGAAMILKASSMGKERAENI